MRALGSQIPFGLDDLGSKAPLLESLDPYLGGQGDLVSRLIIGINGLTIWVTGVINLLTKSS